MKRKNIIISAISVFSFLGFANNNMLTSKINENSWNEGKERQLQFLQLIEHNQNLSDYDKLNLVNDYINEHINFSSDMSLWEMSDYWASPLETLNQGAGDCEDFAIIKYFALKKLGINFNNLRFFYVKYYDGELSLPHMVLGYSTDNTNYLILDNINHKLLSNYQRKDLTPIFSFNEISIFPSPNATIPFKNNISKWNGVFNKAKNEGF